MDQLTGFRIFARVVELGSFSKAADDLVVSQSTVTKHIAWLESHLGARLLNRNTRGISLTEGGGLYYERCKAILKDVDDAAAPLGRHTGALPAPFRTSPSLPFAPP